MPAISGWNGGGVREWLKRTDCKSVAYGYAGSNPASSTIPGRRSGVDPENSQGRGYSSMVEQQPSKLNTRVRFPLPAPVFMSSHAYRPTACTLDRASHRLGRALALAARCAEFFSLDKSTMPAPGCFPVSDAAPICREPSRVKRSKRERFASATARRGVCRAPSAGQPEGRYGLQNLEYPSILIYQNYQGSAQQVR